MIDQQGSLSERFLKKGFWLYVFTVFIAPLGYITKIIISHELLVEEVGILYGIISLITLLAGFNDFGMTDSMNKFLPEYIAKKEYGKVKGLMLVALITQLLTSLAIFAVFFFGSQYIALHFLHAETATSVVQVFAFFFIGLNFFQIISTFFIAVEDTFLNKLSELMRMSGILIFILALFFTERGTLLNFSYGWLFGLSLGIIFSYSIFYFKYYRNYLQAVKIDISKKEIQRIFSFAVTIFLALQAATILGQIDMQMILFILGAKQAGYYTNYLSLIGIPFMILTPIFGLIFPIVSGLSSQKKFSQIALIKETFVKVFMIVSISVSFFFFVFAPEISIFFFGEKFIDSGIILQYAIPFLMFNFLLQINFNIMSGVGYVRERILIVCIAIVCNIITNFFLIGIFGTPGAALASGIGWVLIWILTEKTLYEEYPLKLDFLIVIKNIMGFGILSIGAYKGKEYLGFSNHGDAFFSLGLMLIVYILLFTYINKRAVGTALEQVQKLRKI